MTDSETGKVRSSASRRPVVLAVLGGALLVCLGLAIGLGLGLRALKDEPEVIETVIPLQTAKSKSGTYRFAAIASDADICSDIGRDILARDGGHAVDAAVATMLCIGVVHRHSCGVGGGHFFTIYNRSTETTHVINAREKAPLAGSRDMFVGSSNKAATFGGKAIGVPGDIMGLWTAHQMFGRVPWQELFAPVIRLCQDGVPILPAIHKAISLYKDTLKEMNHTMYFHPETGEIVNVGEKVKYPVLARTLEVIAREGAAAFYNGSLTDDIVADIHDHGGIITRMDLNSYDVSVPSPVSVELRGGLTVHSLPPPSSGVVYQYILNILDGYDFTEDSLSTTEGRTMTYHRIVEAMKFAYAKRSNLGDQDFVNVTELLKNMTSREFSDNIRALITDDHTHNMAYYGPTFYEEEKTGTSHASFLDAQGNAVAITATINTYFGSKVRGSRTGIAFNNEMDDFSTPGLVNSFGVSPSSANFIEPGKRPLSSMCPAILVNRTSGDVVMVIGAAGGTRITTSVALVSALALRLGVSISEAVDSHRVHHQLLPQHIVAETGFQQEIIDGLKAKGHNVTLHSPQAVVNAIHVTGGQVHAVSDVRKGGGPSGY